MQTIEVKEVARVKIGVPYLNDLIESVFPKELILSADCGGTAKTIQVLEFVWLATKL